MNKTYKVVWNQTTHTWTAVSELAVSQGKTKTVKTAVVAAALLASTSAYAVDETVGQTGTVGGVEISSSIRSGVALAPLTVTNQAPQGQTNAKGATVNAYDGIAIGSGSHSGGDSIADGNTGGNGHIAIGLMAKGTGGGAGLAQAAVSIGAYSGATGGGGTALGGFSKAGKMTNDQITASGADAVTNTGLNNTAVGNQAGALGQGTSALGVLSEAHGWDTTAVGREAKAYGNAGTAVGSHSTAQGLGAVAVGSKSIASATNAVAIGGGNTAYAEQAAQATAESAIAIGRQSRSVNTHAIAIGRESSAVSSDSVIIGTRAQGLGEAGSTTSRRGIAIGAESKTGDRGIAVGYQSSASTTDAIAIGDNASTAGIRGISIGRHAQASALNSIAIGSGNQNAGEVVQVSGTRSVAIGGNINVASNNVHVLGKDITVAAGKDNAVVLGTASDGAAVVKAVNSADVAGITYSSFAGHLGGTETDGKPQNAAANRQGRFVSIGSGGSERQIKHVAAGEISTTSTDAVNGSQLYMTAKALGDTVKTVLGGTTPTVLSGANGATSVFSRPVDITVGTEDYKHPDTAPTTVAGAIEDLNDYVNAGWKVGDNDGNEQARIAPNGQVNYKAGDGMEVEVAADGNNKANVTYRVKRDVDSNSNAAGEVNVGEDGANNVLNVNENGVSVVRGNIPTAATASNTDTGNVRGRINTAGLDNTKVATVQNVAEAINSAGFVAQAGDTSSLVKAGNKLEIEGTGAASVTATTDSDGIKFTVNVDAANLLENQSGTINQAAAEGDNKGKVAPNAGDENKLTTVQNVADAINSAKWFGKAENLDELQNDRTEKGTAETAIGAGDTVAFQADKNLAVKRTGTTFTYGLAKDIEVNTVQADTSVTVGKPTGTAGEAGYKPATVINQGSVSGLDNHLAAVDAAAKALPETPADQLAKTNEAATLGDVLNAGWNLKANGQDVDAVTHGNAVDFAGGNGVAVASEPNAQTGTSKISFSVKKNETAADLNNDVANNVLNVGTNGVSVVRGNIAAAPSAVSDANVGKVSTTGNDTQVATVKNVADAINSAGFVAKGSGSDGGKLIAAGGTLEVDGANGITVTREDTANGAKFTINLDAVTQPIDAALKGKIHQAATTGADKGKVTVTDSAELLATVGNVADAINSAKWFGKAENLDELQNDRTEKGTEEAAIGAGDTVAFQADKNLAVKRTGTTFTYGLAKDIEVDSVTANNRVTIANKQAADDAAGTPAIDKVVDLVTTDDGDLAIGDIDGNEVKITNVAAGANVAYFDKDGNNLVQVGSDYYKVDEDGRITTEKGEVATADEFAKLPKAAQAAAGLADLDNSEQSNVLTVADAQRLGWVVSVNENDYADSVSNANEVRFNSGNGITVSGKTDETTGIRNINFAVTKDKTSNGTLSDGINVGANGANNVLNVGPNGVSVVRGDIAAAPSEVSDANVGKVSTTGNDTQVATVKNVADAINSAGFVAQAGNTGSLVKAGNKLEIEGTGAATVTATDTGNGIKFTVHVDGTAGTPEAKGTVAADNDGSLYGPRETAQADLAVALIEQAVLPSDASEETKQAAAAKVAAAEKAVEDAANRVATAQNVADAVNQSGFTLKTSANGGTKVGGADELVNPGDAVDLAAGKNLTVTQTQDGKESKVTYALADDIEVNTVQADTSVTVGKPTGTAGEAGYKPATVINQGSVSGLDNHLAAVEAAAKALPETPADQLAKTDEAATLGDVLNAGWNLKANGQDVDAVTHGNAVDFTSADGSVTITSKSENGVATIDLKVDAGKAVDTAISAKMGTIAEANPNAKIVENGQEVDNLNRGKVTVAEADKGKLATVDNVADAINSAKWIAATKDSDEEIATSTVHTDGTTLGAGDTLTLTAGKNLKVNDSGNGNIAFALANDINVHSVTATTANATTVNIGTGDNAVKLTTDANGLHLSGKEGAAVNINNVAPAELSPTSTQAVNGSQLYAANQNIANLGNTINHLGDKMDRMDRDFRAGIAGTNAAASLPQSYLPGKSLIAAAAGTFKGQNALAVGYSSISDNGKWILKAQANVNTRSDVGGGVGVGYLW